MTLKTPSLSLICFHVESVILPEIGQHAEEVLVFFENFIIDNGNLDLLLGDTSLNVLLELFKVTQLYLEAKSALGILEIVTGSGGTVKGLEVNEASAVKIRAHTGNSHNGLATALHYLKAILRFDSKRFKFTQTN